MAPISWSYRLRLLAVMAILFIAAVASAETVNLFIRPFTIDVETRDVRVTAARMHLACAVGRDQERFSSGEADFKVRQVDANHVRLESPARLQIKRWTILGADCAAHLEVAGRRRSDGRETAPYPLGGIEVRLEDQGDGTGYIIDELKENALCFAEETRVIRSRCGPGPETPAEPESEADPNLSATSGAPTTR